MPNEMQAQTLSCPNCGYNLSPGIKICPACNSHLLITTISQLSSFKKTTAAEAARQITKQCDTIREGDPDYAQAMLARGIAYLQLKNYTLATKSFERAIDKLPESAEAHYYYALSLIGGRRPMTLDSSKIERIEEFLNTALQLDDSKAHYHLLSYIIKKDYYEEKGLMVRGLSAGETLGNGNARGRDPEEIKQLLDQLILRDDKLIAAVRGEE